MEYRVLSMWQPWGSLLVHNIKKYETRPSPTNWTVEKGTYLIHAAQKWGKVQNDICNNEPFRFQMRKMKIWNGSTHGVGGSTRNNWEFPLGCIIGSVEVIECIEINSCIIDKYASLMNGQVIDGNEFEFGNYLPGRYVWICQNPRILVNPIPYRGGQGYYQKFNGDISELIFK